MIGLMLSVCLSVRHCGKSEQVNRKCRPRNYFTTFNPLTPNRQTPHRQDQLTACGSVVIYYTIRRTGKMSEPAKSTIGYLSNSLISC